MIVTDSKDPSKVPLDPTKCNAFAIHQLVASREESDLLALEYRTSIETGFLGYGVTKARIQDAMEKRFGKHREEYLRLLNPNSELSDILHEGGKKARAEARKTLDGCRSIVGLI